MRYLGLAKRGLVRWPWGRWRSIVGRRVGIRRSRPGYGKMVCQLYELRKLRLSFEGLGVAGFNIEEGSC